MQIYTMRNKPLMELYIEEFRLKPERSNKPSTQAAFRRCQVVTSLSNKSKLQHRVSPLFFDEKIKQFNAPIHKLIYIDLDCLDIDTVPSRNVRRGDRRVS